MIEGHMQLTSQFLELSNLVRGTSFANNNFLTKLWIFGYVNMHTTPLHPNIVLLYLSNIFETITRTTIDGNRIVVKNSIIDILQNNQTSDRMYFLIYRNYFFPRFVSRFMLGDCNTAISESLGYVLKDILKNKTNHHQALTRQTSNTRLIKLVFNRLIVQYPQVVREIDIDFL